MYAAITSFVLDYNDHNNAIEISKRLARVVVICERKIEKSKAREISKGNFVLDLVMYHEKPKSQWLKQENSQSSSEVFCKFLKKCGRMKVCEVALCFP